MHVKKILILVESPTFNPLNRYSAVSAVIYSFAGLLHENGFQVSINGESIDQIREKEDRAVANVGIQSPFYYRLFPKRMREAVKDLLLFNRLPLLHQKLEALSKPDIIISWISYGSSYSVDLAKHWNIPLVSIFDNPLNDEYAYLFGFKPFFHKRIDKHEGRMLRNSAAIIAYSHAVKDHIDKKYGLNSNCYYKAFTDFKRMSFSNYQRQAAIPTFAYIGSFFKWHNIDQLLSAFEATNDQGRTCCLTFIGNGVEFESIKMLASTSKYKQSIVFTGRLDAAALEAQMAKINVGVIPGALWFQAPVKLFQYAAAQLPVLCRNTPTMLELTGDSDGFIFFDSAQQLTKRMVVLVDNADQLSELGTKAQSYARQHFSKESYLNLFQKIFASL
jgi:glycosyltransferase involved in cell wall biosynthesis